MDEHRLTGTTRITSLSLDPPFSSFQYIEESFGRSNYAIRRLFSLARAHSARTLIVEDIEPFGIISDENDEIKEYYPDYEMTGLKRISFWRTTFTIQNDNLCSNEDCIGYAILKNDRVNSIRYDRWHVFEAVFEKYNHEHNVVPNPMSYEVNLGIVKVNIKGLLYAQQNALNKSCAQVALRSVISRIKQRDISYREINNIARESSEREFSPGNGLEAFRIRAVLSGNGIGFRDFDYTQYEDESDTPSYLKFLYSGVESGTGALVGFKLTGSRDKHIIPFYGHTFNKDTWVPHADIAYFRVGGLGYVPSETWTSSFLGHDDNFGLNFCIPRLYIRPEQVDYVVELLKPGFVYGGGQAEALAIQFLYSALSRINTNGNPWLERLAYYADPEIERVVFRPLALSKEIYINHLINERDWEQNSESIGSVDILSKWLPEKLWIIEVSIPQLFPANERKLGEIVLDGGIDIDSSLSEQNYLACVRLPGHFLSKNSSDSSNNEFLIVPSNITSHFPLISLS